MADIRPGESDSASNRIDHLAGLYLRFEREFVFSSTFQPKAWGLLGVASDGGFRHGGAFFQRCLMVCTACSGAAMCLNFSRNYEPPPRVISFRFCAGVRRTHTGIRMSSGRRRERRQLGVDVFFIEIPSVLLYGAGLPGIVVSARRSAAASCSSTNAALAAPMVSVSRCCTVRSSEASEACGLFPEISANPLLQAGATGGASPARAAATFSATVLKPSVSTRISSSCRGRNPEAPSAGLSIALPSLRASTTAWPCDALRGETPSSRNFLSAFRASLRASLNRSRAATAMTAVVLR